MMRAAIRKNNLMKWPIVVSLKGGASDAEALIYMKSSEGDPNKVLIAYSLIYMLPLSAKIRFNWRDLTPVSATALDQFGLQSRQALRQGQGELRQGPHRGCLRSGDRCPCLRRRSTAADAGPRHSRIGPAAILLGGPMVWSLNPGPLLFVE